jgi:hypothetical protein
MTGTPPPKSSRLMGITFDLDVCAPKGGLDWIPATKHYSIEDDALTQKWEGRVWMNPPFSGNSLPFVGKWIREHGNGMRSHTTKQVAMVRITMGVRRASIVVPDLNPAVRFIREGVRQAGPYS